MVAINKIPFGTGTFPNGETIFKTDEINLRPQGDGLNCISVVFEDDSDITKLIVAKKFIDDTSLHTAETYLDIKYFPYSRMDRKIGGYAFSLKYVCDIINSLNFNRVQICDPHSNVVTALLNKCHAHYYDISSLVDNNCIDYVFYPDNGAVKKYTEVSEYKCFEYFYGNKKRNLNTGRITDYELVNAPNINDMNILIVDDICVKGGTFILAAQALKAAGANEVNLFVTHLEKAVYDGDLLTTKWINHIYTPNTMGIDIHNDKITTIGGRE